MRRVTTKSAAFSFAVCAIAVAAVAGCASRVTGEGDGSESSGETSDAFAPPDGEDVPPDIQYRDVPFQYDVYHEDACMPFAEAGTRDYQCDPFNPTTGCPDGQACYVGIDYPFGNCGQEVYTATCEPAGTTAPDGFCTNGIECQPGYGCWVTGAGDRCLQLCRLDGSAPQCPEGRVCQVTDIPDFGACD